MKLKFILLLSFIFIFALAASAQSGRKSGQTADGQNKNEAAPQEDRPVKIIKKTPPSARVFMLCFREEGFAYVKTKVRATFADSGKITSVEITEPSGCNRFDEESTRVARLIKFEPAIKDGKPQTVSKIVLYEGGTR